ncbi:MAG: LamG domain-containing protein [Candidatus Bathyarchaeia archaeon]
MQYVPPQKSEYALEFDGVDDYALVPNSASLNITKEITIEAWIKPIMPQVQGAGVVSKGYSGGGEVYVIDFGDGAHVRFFFWSPLHHEVHATVADQATIWGGEWYEGDWYHIAGVYNGSTLAVYINGHLEATASGPEVLDKNDSPLSFGAREIHGGNFQYNYKGLIDDVRLYKTALSEDEILANMNGDVVMDGLVSWWTFEEGSGDKIGDLAGSGNDGTIHGATWRRHATPLDWYLFVLRTDELCVIFSAVGFAFLSIGLPWALADSLMPRSERFRAFTSKGIPRRIGSYFKENPSSAPILVFIVGMVLTPFAYLLNEVFANAIVMYTFWFLVVGVVWQIIRLIRTS